MQQERMFRLAPEGLSVSAFFAGAEGWHCIIRVRLGDETWSETEPIACSHLTTSELVDFIEATLHSELLLRKRS